jgi:hypothetical protein
VFGARSEAFPSPLAANSFRRDALDDISRAAKRAAFALKQ